MRPNAVSAALATLLLAATASAGTFIVPADEELVAKSAAIVAGTVEGSFVQATETTIETVNEIRIERAFKGTGLRRGALLRVVTLGGVIEDRGLLVPGEAHFRGGEHVLLFLTRDDDGRWRATDLTLGKFKFVTSTAGDRVLVRDMEDVVGWDRAGNVHHERVRREEGFLQFVEERAKGRAAAPDYMVDASEVTIAPDEGQQWAISTNAAPFPGSTYTSWVNNQPNRWPNIANGINFFKRSDQNIAGASDGGVSAIQSGLAAWTNECGSVINLSYGGQLAHASANHDSTNVVEYNDPQGRVSGSWGGSGTIAITFISFAGEHSFAGQVWLNITDADVVFQDGFPATSPAFAPAMTHELGHGLGFRHSNQDYATGGACNPAVEECTSAAIMNSSVNGNYGFTLQPWDINAAQSVYPGGTCGPVCTPPTITGQPQSQTIAPGSSATLSVAATGTGGPFTYQWYIGPGGNTSNPVPGATASTLTVTPGMTTSYWVQVASSCGLASSANATVVVTTVAVASGTAAQLFLVTPCRIIDTRGGPPNYSQNTQLVQITGRCGVPAGAKSVVMNITAVSPSANGFLTVYPGTGASPPSTSTLSYRTNRTRANNAVMRLSSDGRVSVFNGGPPVHFLIDVTGYFQ
jgi:hypothetical protein